MYELQSVDVEETPAERGRRAKRLRDPKHCWRCGADCAHSGEAVTVEGWYGDHRIAWLAKPAGPHLVSVLCLPCRVLDEEESRTAEVDYQRHCDAEADRHNAELRAQPW